jgi:hypothetical protein
LAADNANIKVYTEDKHNIDGMPDELEIINYSKLKNDEQRSRSVKVLFQQVCYYSQLPNFRVAKQPAGNVGAVSMVRNQPKISATSNRSIRKNGVNASISLTSFLWQVSTQAYHATRKRGLRNREEYAGDFEGHRAVSGRPGVPQTVCRRHGAGAQGRNEQNEIRASVEILRQLAEQFPEDETICDDYAVAQRIFEKLS